MVVATAAFAGAAERRTDSGPHFVDTTTDAGVCHSRCGVAAWLLSRWRCCGEIGVTIKQKKQERGLHLQAAAAERIDAFTNGSRVKRTSLACNSIEIVGLAITC